MCACECVWRRKELQFHFGWNVVKQTICRMYFYLRFFRWIKTRLIYQCMNTEHWTHWMWWILLLTHTLVACLSTTIHGIKLNSFVNFFVVVLLPWIELNWIELNWIDKQRINRQTFTSHRIPSNYSILELKKKFPRQKQKKSSFVLSQIFHDWIGNKIVLNRSFVLRFNLCMNGKVFGFWFLFWSVFSFSKLSTQVRSI